MEQSVNVARRNLLRGRPPSAPPAVRPPGAIDETDFASRCTACGDCMTACPQHIIIAGSGGYPEVDFRNGECTFCSACIDVCVDDAISRTVQPPWHLELQLGDNCLARRQVVCQTCQDSCGTDAIRFRPMLGAVAVPEIDKDACNGCGACVAACPEHALKAVVHG